MLGGFLYNDFMNKKLMRKEIVTKRNSISADVRQEKSILIKERLQKLKIFAQAYTVLFYVSFGSEVETHQLIKDTLKTEKQVAVPLAHKDGLLIKIITDFKQVKPGTWNILEPSNKQPDIDLKVINLVIVPGVAFSKNHYRLGYGGGYYDKLLSQEDEAGFTSIGLAFDEQIVNELPVEKHDKKVDFVLTDKRII